MDTCESFDLLNLQEPLISHIIGYLGIFDMIRLSRSCKIINHIVLDHPIYQYYRSLFSMECVGASQNQKIREDIIESGTYITEYEDEVNVDALNHVKFSERVLIALRTCDASALNYIVKGESDNIDVWYTIGTYCDTPLIHDLLTTSKKYMKHIFMAINWLCVGSVYQNDANKVYSFILKGCPMKYCLYSCCYYRKKELFDRILNSLRKKEEITNGLMEVCLFITVSKGFTDMVIHILGIYRFDKKLQWLFPTCIPGENLDIVRLLLRYNVMDDQEAAIWVIRYGYYDMADELDSRGKVRWSDLSEVFRRFMDDRANYNGILYVLRKEGLNIISVAEGKSFIDRVDRLMTQNGDPSEVLGIACYAFSIKSISYIISKIPTFRHLYLLEQIKKLMGSISPPDPRVADKALLDRVDPAKKWISNKIIEVKSHK